MSKKVLITGASGLLGRPIYKEFVGDGSWEVLGLAFSRCSGSLRKVDLTKSEEIKNVITEFKPSVVIHSAAERRPDVVENQPDATKALNIAATRTVCEQARDIGAWVLYISTDYVFDGTSPPYSEDAMPNPLNTYGQTKLEGERVTMEINPENSIIRVPILYGQVENLDESAVTVLFKKVKDTTKKCVMSDYERRYPAYCNDIATTIRQLSEKRLSNTSVKGIYHFPGEKMFTKYDMAIAMAQGFSLPTSHIEADKNPSAGAPRPFDSQLSGQRIKDLGFYNTSPFKETIVDVLKEHYKS